MERFKARPDEQILLKGSLTYHKSKWSYVECEGVLTSKRFVMGQKIHSAWGLGPLLFSYIKGKKILFEIPLQNFLSIQHNQEELGDDFILKTTDGAEYSVTSADFFSKKGRWIQSIAAAVKTACPDVEIKANPDVVEFRKEPSTEQTGPQTPFNKETFSALLSFGEEIFGAAGIAPLAKEKRRRKMIIVAIVAGLVVVTAIRFFWNRNGAPYDVPGMVYVPGGEFTMGRDDTDEYERPAHKVTVSRFFIDMYEVTNEDWKACFIAGLCRPPKTWIFDAAGTPRYPPDVSSRATISYPAGTGRQPVTGVGLNEAQEYAKWAGKRIPTEQEWEFAARGPDGRRYPWGNDWNAGLANADGASNGLADVGTYKGASPFGAFDMVGNASEWTDSKIFPYAGGRWREAWVNVDPDKLRSYNVTLEDVTAALRAQNVDVQNKNVEVRPQLIALVKGNLDPSTLNGLVVGTRNNYQVQLNDIGWVELVNGGTVIRGGTFVNTRAQATTTYRRNFATSSTSRQMDVLRNIGFRCVKGVVD